MMDRWMVGRRMDRYVGRVRWDCVGWVFAHLHICILLTRENVSAL